MTKTNYLKRAVAVLALFVLLSCVSFPVYASAEETTYKTGVSITKQGENGFYYAWGTPDNCVLMEYGYGYSESILWHGLELYSHIESGNSVHPGTFWGVMIIWVAKEGGTVTLTGKMEKGSNSGDGVNLGIYHYSGENKTAVFEKFVDGQGERTFPIDTTLNLKKGDNIVFYCDSGNAKDNSADSCGFPCEIKYTQRDGDIETGDLAKYLNVGRAGDVGGFKHIDKPYGAEVTDGTLTKKETTTSSGCGANAMASGSFIAVVLAAFAACVALNKRRKAK